jgi:hypothetical protein
MVEDTSRSANRSQAGSFFPRSCPSNYPSSSVFLIPHLSENTTQSTFINIQDAWMLGYDNHNSSATYKGNISNSNCLQLAHQFVIWRSSLTATASSSGSCVVIATISSLWDSVLYIQSILWFEVGSTLAASMRLETICENEMYSFL